MNIPLKQDLAFLLIVLLAGGIALIIYYLRFSPYRSGQKEENYKIEREKRRVILEATISTQEQERSRIARNLHDSVGAELSMIKLNLSKYAYELSKKNVDTSALEKQLLQLDQTVDNIRSVCRDLYPVSLQSNGFIRTFEELVGRINSTNTIVCNYKFNLKEEDLFPEIESKLSLLRIFQELVNNLIKYANCNALDIGFMKYGQVIKIILKHNGVPFDNTSVSQMLKQGRGVGLSSIDNRINLMKGKIDYSQVNKGSEIIIELPLQYGGQN